MTAGASWWRRNRLAVLVLPALAAVTAVIGIWIPIVQSGAVDTLPPAVTRDGTAHFGSSTARITAAGVFHPGVSPSLTAPKGAMVLAVLVRIRSSGALSCEIRLAERTTDKIFWRPIDTPSDFGYRLSDSTDHYCLIDEKGTTTVEQTFLLPDDVYRRVALRVTLRAKGEASRSLDLLLPRKPVRDPGAETDPGD